MAFITSYNFITHDIFMTFQNFSAEILNFKIFLVNKNQYICDSRNFPYILIE